MKIDTMSVVPGNFIAINREGYECEPFVIESHPLYGAVHALQWFGEHGGQIEYEKGPAGGVTLDLFKPYIRPWQAAKAKALRGRADQIAINLEQATKQIAEHKVMIEHLDEQLTSLDKQIEEANEATRGGLQNAKTRLANAFDRMKSELAALEQSETDLISAIDMANEAADKAEADLATAVTIDQT